jgi:hypothetical protein
VIIFVKLYGSEKLAAQTRKTPTNFTDSEFWPIATKPTSYFTGNVDVTTRTISIAVASFVQQETTLKSLSSTFPTNQSCSGQ